MLNTKLIAQIVGLVLLIALAFVVNAYASSYFAAYIFPLVQPRSYTEMISSAVVGSIAAGTLVAYPLIKLFPQRYWLAALVVSIPVLEMRGRDFLRYFGGEETRIVVMSIVEFVVYPTAILACSWIASRLLGDKAELSENAPR